MSISLTLACGAYDRTIALALGDVAPAGIDLTYLRLPVEEIFWRMTRHREFDAAEMSLSSYLIRRSRGDDALIAIPVFTSRFFRHSCVFVNAAAGIERPQDLAGKRIGVPEYQMTAVVWIRGFLEDDYGVRPRDVRWLQGGLEQPGRVEKLPIEIPGVEIAPIGEYATLSGLLAAGELDALIGARAPSSFAGDRVRRLFPDFRTVEVDYFRRTCIFPIMHTVVIRREVLDRHPWVARSLYDALCAAKARTLEELGSSVALAASVPWLLAELEATRALMGDHYWPYGVEPNRVALEALAHYSHAQGLAARLVPIEERCDHVEDAPIGPPRQGERWGNLGPGQVRHPCRPRRPPYHERPTPRRGVGYAHGDGTDAWHGARSTRPRREVDDGSLGRSGDPGLDPPAARRG